MARKRHAPKQVINKFREAEETIFEGKTAALRPPAGQDERADPLPMA